MNLFAMVFLLVALVSIGVDIAFGLVACICADISLEWARLKLIPHCWGRWNDGRRG